MSEITIIGGCRTMVADVDQAYDVTFTGHHGALILAVTPAGDLVLGPAFDGEEKLAEKLVDYFGGAYGGRLQAVEERARAAEAKARNMQARLAASQGLVRHLEDKLARFEGRVRRVKEARDR